MAVKVGGIVVDLVANTARFTRGIASAESTTGRFVRSTTASFAKISKAVVASAAAASAGLAFMVRRTGLAIDEQVKFARRIGITQAELAGLEIAASRTGVGIDTLRRGLQNMVKQIGDAANGTGEAREALFQLGLDARALAQLSPEEQFRAIADAMSGISNETGRVTIAFKLFGARGAGLLNTLALGSKALAQFSSEARDFGTALSEDQASAVEAMNDRIDDMKRLLGGLFTQITAELAPAVVNLTKRFLAFAKSMGGVGPVAKSTLSGIIKAVSTITVGLRGLFAIFQSGIGVVLKGLSKALGLFPGLENFSQALEQEADDLVGKLNEVIDSTADIGNIDDLFAPIAESAQVASDSVGDVSDAVRESLREFENLQREAERVIEETRTPQERFEKELEKLKKLFDRGLIDEDTFNRAVEKARKQLEEATKSVKAEVDISEPKAAQFRQITRGQLERTAGLGIVDPQTKALNSLREFLQREIVIMREQVTEVARNTIAPRAI